MDCLLQVRNELKYLQVLFTSEGMTGHEIDRRTAGATLHVLHRAVVTCCAREMVYLEPARVRVSKHKMLFSLPVKNICCSEGSR